jgi:hypothetical protein
LTDTTPTTAPGTLPGRARATGRPSTVAEGSRDLLWAAGSGRPRPFLDGEPQRTPGLEVKPSNISLTPRSRPDLTLRPCRPASAPATPPITRRSHDEPRHRPTSISVEGEPPPRSDVTSTAQFARLAHRKLADLPEPAPPRAGACAARAPARQRAAHPTRANAPRPALEQTVAREAAGVLAWSTRALAAHAASTTTSASRGSRERSAGRHLRRDAARRRRAHQVGRPRLRHAARPRERRRNRLTGTRAQARKPSPSRGAGASTGVTWPHPFDSPSSRVAGRVTPPGAAGAPTGPPR